MKIPSRFSDLLPILILILNLAFPAASPANETSDLRDHPSPYLALHADDPVRWRVWGQPSLDEASQAGRLIFVSVGYFSCHWCHVMQRESYQNEAVADVLNRSYVSVKVDRELQPELDQQLISFVEQVRGSAGWPLNVFLTPEGYPLTGFTYLPPEEFHSLLEKLENQWRDNHEELSKAAERFYVRQMEEAVGSEFQSAQFPVTELTQAYISQAMLIADELQGGFGTTSKFPNVPQLSSLLQIVKSDAGIDPDVPDFVRLTLSVMASSHLHDHINGGFFRYTTDPDWQTPHYEKMLYDNAQLATLYLQAHSVWPDQGFQQVGLRTLEFVESSLRHRNGGYMSSLSAVDVDDVEGGDYFWSQELLKRYLEPAEVEYLGENWQLSSQDSEFLAEPLIGPGSSGDPATNQTILTKLQQRGYARTPVDDKRLASWNAMLLKALVQAAEVDAGSRKRAQDLYSAMQSLFYPDGKLLRLANNERVAVAGLEDYAQVAHAFALYADRFNDKTAREQANQLIETARIRFVVDGRWQIQADAAIPAAQAEWVIADDVFFSPMTQWLAVALSASADNSEVRNLAREMANRVNSDMLDSPYFYGSFIVLDRQQSGS